MIEQRFEDCRVFVNGVDYTGITGESVLRCNAKVEKGISDGCQVSRNTGDIAVEFEHEGCMRWIREAKFEKSEVEVIEGNTRYAFLADEVSVKETGTTNGIRWFQVIAKGRGPVLVT